MKYIKNALIVFGLYILSQVGMFVFGFLKGMVLTTENPSLSTTNTMITILIVIANVALMMWLAMKLNLCTFKFDWMTKKNFLFIFLCYFAGRIVAIVGTLLGQIIDGQETTTNDAAINQIFAGESPLLLFLLIAIAAPIMEEIVFRGGIMGLMFKDQPFVGMAVSSIIFGLIHSPTTFIEFMLYGLLGFIMAFAYYRSKRLEVAIGVHFVNNAISTIALIFMLQ